MGLSLLTFEAQENTNGSEERKCRGWPWAEEKRALSTPVLCVLGSGPETPGGWCHGAATLRQSVLWAGRERHCAFTSIPGRLSLQRHGSKGILPGNAGPSPPRFPQQACAEASGL